jgi:acyl-coenzyme A thioesterase PaaI-like protein
MTLCVTSDPPSSVLAEVARQAAALADELADAVPEPDPVPTGRYADETEEPGQAMSLAAAMPFDMVIGPCNPLAPPLVLELDPPVARGRATFTPPFEGAPGCVHGAALAATFDIMLTAANVIADAAGPTVELRIRYLKPTLIDRPASFEASVVSVEGRRTHSTGRLIQDGVVTVEAEGEFMTLRRGRVEALHRLAASRRQESTSTEGSGRSQEAGPHEEPAGP